MKLHYMYCMFVYISGAGLINKPTARRKFPWHVSFNPIPFFILLDQRFYIVKNIYIYIYIYIYMYIYVFDCVGDVHEIPLLPNNTASETFLLKSGRGRSVYCRFIIGAPA